MTDPQPTEDREGGMFLTFTDRDAGADGVTPEFIASVAEQNSDLELESATFRITGDGEDTEDREHTGDPMTVHPRLECTECGAFVYATYPRGWVDGPPKLECECRAVDAEDAPAEVWRRAY